MTEFRVDAIVIGAGVVGLAIARRMALVGLETLVIEKEKTFGTATSSRNSGVIHAGLYYPTGSLKHCLCLLGKHLLYRYCESRGIPTDRCGKIVVATSLQQSTKLTALYAKAQENGVEGLRWLSQDEMTEMEPEVLYHTAFLSPDSGILDTFAYLSSLEGEVRDAGGMIAYNTCVRSIVSTGNELHVLADDGAAIAVAAPVVINAAGHGAIGIATRTQGLASAFVPRQSYAKGNYFSLVGRQPFKHLIYPIPEAAGLGIHATLDFQGRCRFGPDVEWVEDDEDFTVDHRRAKRFYEAIRSYWPDLPDNALQPDFAGIRPKIHVEHEAMPDFRVSDASEHGVPGLINLFGIESPGLTSSLALADHVVSLAGFFDEGR